MTATAMKNETHQMIDEMDSDQLTKAFAYLKTCFEKKRREDEISEGEKAFQELEAIIASKPFASDDFDPDNERMEALLEKYGHLD